MDSNHQLALIAEDSEDALLLSADECAKRYTARSTEKIGWRRDCILALLGCGLPIEDVAHHAHCSTRIVKALGGKHSQAVAANSMTFAQVLKSKAAKFLFLAEQKADTAKFGELMIGVGIAAQRGQEAELAGAGSHLQDAIDADVESPAVVEAKRIALMLHQRNEEGRMKNEEAAPVGKDINV